MQIEILITAIVKHKWGKLVVAFPAAVASFRVVQVEAWIVHEWLPGEMMLIFAALMIRFAF